MSLLTHLLEVHLLQIIYYFSLVSSSKLVLITSYTSIIYNYFNFESYFNEPLFDSVIDLFVNGKVEGNRSKLYNL